MTLGATASKSFGPLTTSQRLTPESDIYAEIAVNPFASALAPADPLARLWDGSQTAIVYQDLAKLAVRDAIVFVQPAAGGASNRVCVRIISIDRASDGLTPGYALICFRHEWKQDSKGRVTTLASPGHPVRADKLA